MENPHFVVLLLTFQNQWDGQNDQELMHSQHKSALSCFFLLAKKEVRVIYFLTCWTQFYFQNTPAPWLTHIRFMWTSLTRQKDQELMHSQLKSALLCFFLLAKKEVRVIYYFWIFITIQSNLALRNFLVTAKKFLKVKSSLFQTFNQSTI